MVLIFIILLSTSLYSAGYIYTPTYIGKPVSLDPVSISLAHTQSLINSLSVINSAPAQLVDFEDRTVEVTFGTSFLEEKIIENKQLPQLNKLYLPLVANFGIYYPLRTNSFIKHIGFGLSYSTEYESNYNFPDIKFESQGWINSITVPVVIGSGNIAIGVGIKNFIGTKKIYSEFIPNFNTLCEISGLGYLASVKLKIKTVDINFSYIPQTELVLKNTQSETTTFLPHKTVFAVRQNFVDNSSLCVEFKSLLYNKVDDKYTDTIPISVGIEKNVAENTVLRFGFFYEPNYVVKGSVIAGISGGLGLDISKFRFNIGISYSKENYKGDNIIFSDKKVIDESYTYISLGIRYSF